jgi:hypothetical protein
MLVWHSKDSELLPVTVLHDVRYASVVFLHHVLVNSLGVSAEVPLLFSRQTFLFLRLGISLNLHLEIIILVSAVDQVLTICWRHSGT